MKKVGSIVLGVAVSGLLLFLALRHVTWGEVARSVTSIRPFGLVAIVLISMLDLLIRSLRWRLLLSFGVPLERPRLLWDLFRLEAVGLAVNNVVFLRLGEFARAYLAGLTLEVPGLTVLATIVVERTLDMTALMLLFASAAWFYPDTVAPALYRLALLIAAGLIAALAAILYFDRRIKQGGGWTERLRSYPSVHRVVEQVALGSSALNSWRVCVPVGLLSLSLWVVDAFGYWVCGKAMGLAVLSYGRSVLLLATAAAAGFLPTVPGGFGAYEQFIKVVLVSWHVPEATALGFAGVVHVVSYIFVTGLGIVFLYQAGHSLSSLSSALRSRFSK